MKRKKRIEITRESEHLVRVRLPEDAATDWCPACAAVVRWVTVLEAAAISGVGEREIYRCVEAGSLHRLERPSAAVLVCFLSLTRSMR